MVVYDDDAIKPFHRRDSHVEIRRQSKFRGETLLNHRLLEPGWRCQLMLFPFIVSVWEVHAQSYVSLLSCRKKEKAVQLTLRCLSRDPKTQPLMSEVLNILKPLPNLKDMANSFNSFQSMQSERGRPNSTSRNGKAHGAPQRNGQQPGLRSLSIPNGSRASPYHHQYHPSPKPSGKF